MATSFIIGDAMRKEKVTPNGTPDSTNPMKSGTAEQEQKGVIMPIKAATTFPRYSFLFPKAFLTFRGDI
jgi:hypothetical protein